MQFWLPLLLCNLGIWVYSRIKRPIPFKHPLTKNENTEKTEENKHHRSQIQLHSATGQTLCFINHSCAWCAWNPWLQLIQNTTNLRINSASVGLRCSCPVSPVILARDIGSGEPSQKLQTPHRGIWRPHLGHTVPDMVGAPNGLPIDGWTTSTLVEGGIWEDVSCCVSGLVQ